MKTVLITGAGGIAGRALARHFKSSAGVAAYSHSELDITDPRSVRNVFQDRRPDVVINCAAYTQVDRAEEQPELARKVNTEGPRILAQALEETGGKLVHLSTDYVFDGAKRTPYGVDDAVSPLGIYAQTKADGEKSVLGVSGRHLVIRVAWLFMTGGGTFLCRLKNLIAAEEHLRVADDRQGACTYAPDFARALSVLLERGARGIIHFTNSGSCSWFGFAEALVKTARSTGFPVRVKRIERISSKSLPMKASRPEYSVLNLGRTVEILGETPRPWQETLVDFLAETG